MPRCHGPQGPANRADQIWFPHLRGAQDHALWVQGKYQSSRNCRAKSPAAPCQRPDENQPCRPGGGAQQHHKLRPVGIRAQVAVDPGRERKQAAILVAGKIFRKNRGKGFVGARQRQGGRVAPHRICVEVTRSVLNVFRVTELRQESFQTHPHSQPDQECSRQEQA